MTASSAAGGPRLAGSPTPALRDECRPGGTSRRARAACADAILTRPRRTPRRARKAGIPAGPVNSPPTSSPTRRSSRGRPTCRAAGPAVTVGADADRPLRTPLAYERPRPPGADTDAVLGGLGYARPRSRRCGRAASSGGRWRRPAACRVRRLRVPDPREAPYVPPSPRRLIAPARPQCRRRPPDRHAVRRGLRLDVDRDGLRRLHGDRPAAARSRAHGMPGISARRSSLRSSSARSGSRRPRRRGALRLARRRQLMAIAAAISPAAIASGGRFWRVGGLVLVVAGVWMFQQSG